MKKLLFSVTALLFIVAACNTSESATNDDGENNLSLRVSSGFSPEHGWFEGFFTPWMDTVQEESDGQLEFELFTSGELVSINNEVDALETGTIDIALPVFPLYDPQKFPLSEVTFLPVIDTDAVIATEAFENLLNSDVELMDGKTFYEFEYEDNGLKAIAAVSTEPYLISTVGHTFEAVEDFNNKQLRTGGRVHEMYVQHLGANTITMPFTEMYDALSRGAIEGNLMAISDWKSNGIDDLFQYTIKGANLGHYNVVIGLTEDKWNQLPENIQGLLETKASELLDVGAEHLINIANETEEESSVNGAVFENLDDLTPEVRNHMVSAMEQTWTDWIAMMEDNGLPGKAVALLWRDLIIEAGGDVPEGVKDLE